MDYVKALYDIQAEDLEHAATAIARGQSVGNPDLRTKSETKDFLRKFGATWKKEAFGIGNYWVQWPIKIFQGQGLDYLLRVLMGGQTDIDEIRSCELVDLDLGKLDREFQTDQTRVYRAGIGRPLICGIIKPKIGLSPEQLASKAHEMAQAGCDVIKEDEILADQKFCRLQQRLEILKDALPSKTIYLVSCSGDGGDLLKKVDRIGNFGRNIGVHINFWHGLGVVHYLRKKYPNLIMMYQRSGIRTITEGRYRISPKVFYKLVGLTGVDFAHVGMYGGYMADTITDLKDRIQAMKPTIPSFSCGMNPELAKKCKELFGNEIMVTSGGWIHSQEKGLQWAVEQMRKAVE